MLTLATSERGVEQWDAIDLAEIAEGVLASRRELARAQGLTVETSLAQAPLAGDPALVELLVTNLVENALRHNIAGGALHVLTTFEGDGATLIVGNTGPFVPESAVPRLFQPFQTGGVERTGRVGGIGLGLGLAIVRAIADAHGAKIVATPRSAGGLEITVSFPTSSAAVRDRAQPPDEL